MADRAEEKENRINSFALSFLERQQIVPNLYADQIVRGYKEGYHQAEKDVVEKACYVIRHKYGEYHYLRGDITEDLIRMFKQAMNHD